MEDKSVEKRDLSMDIGLAEMSAVKRVALMVG
jgi:hypothetical protein